MSLDQRILRLLHEKIGFNPESIGSEKILSAVRATLGEKKIDDPESFLSGLRGGNAEFHKIVDAVVIPETWFFRDDTPFEYLKRHVSGARLPLPGETLRCLSLPCSTGEEPYSIAMTLLDAGLAPQQFQIDAVDISSQSLERARAGQYGPYSFRSADISFRERFFEQRQNSYHLKDTVRNSVRFSKGNLLDPFFANERPPYDIVFCRNLLIYFDAHAWSQATKTLHQVLKDTGLLFMGHAELLEMSDTAFESIRVPMAFAYRKKKVKPADNTAKGASKTLKSGARTPHKKQHANVPVRALKPVQPKPRREESKAQPFVPAESIVALMEQATRLADQGSFAQAKEICQRCLTAFPATARAYFLLGLIAEVSGDAAEAEQQYTRSLYLDSRHQETMVHLALLLEGRGDAAGAANLRKRASAAGKAGKES